MKNVRSSRHSQDYKEGFNRGLYRKDDQSSASRPNGMPLRRPADWLRGYRAGCARWSGRR
jgi:hypothetical protein